MQIKICQPLKTITFNNNKRYNINNDNKIKKTKLKTVQIKVLYAFKINQKGPHKSRSVNNENMTTIKGKRSMEIVIGEQKI
jgi:hypothetical protein